MTAAINTSSIATPEFLLPISIAAKQVIDRIASDLYKKHKHELHKIYHAVGEDLFSTVLINVKHSNITITEAVRICQQFGLWSNSIIKSYEQLSHCGEDLSKIGEKYDKYFKLIINQIGATYPFHLRDGILQCPAAAAAFRKDPEQFLSFVRRWGDAAIAIFEKRGIEGLELSGADIKFYDEFIGLCKTDKYYNCIFVHRIFESYPELWRSSSEVFLSLATIMKGKNSQIFTHITKELLCKCPNRVIELAIVLRRASSTLIEHFAAVLPDLNSNEFASLVKVYTLWREDNEKIPQAMLPDNPKAIICNLDKLNDIVCSYEPEIARGILKAFGYHAAELTSAELKELDAIVSKLMDCDLDDRVGDCISYIRLDLMRHLPGYYLKLANILRQDSLNAFYKLDDYPHLAVFAPDALLAASEKLGYHTATTIAVLNSRVREPARISLLLPLVNRIGSYANRVLMRVSEDFARTNSTRILEHANKYKHSFATMYARLGESRYFEFEEANRELIGRIIDKCKGGAPDYFEHIPVDLWNNEQILTATDVYEEATGLEYKARNDKFFDGETTELRALRLEAKAKFGIKNFYRYCKFVSNDNINPAIIHRNFTNFNNARYDKRPIFVHALPLSDWNLAFSNHAKATEKLSKAHNIIYIEYSSVTELDRLIREIACLRGVDSEGNPLKPIENICISAHSSENGMYAGYLSEEERVAIREDKFALGDSYIARRDFALFNGWANLIANGAFVVLDGCSTARGKYGQNIASNVKRALPHTRVCGSREPCGISHYQLNKLGRILDVVFSGNSVSISEPIVDDDWG